MSENKKTIFDYLNSIFYKKDIEFYKNECSRYMLLLWLSHDKELLELTNDINQYIFNVMSDDELVYKCFFHKVPKKKRFIKYVKKDKKKDNKEIEQLMKQYNMSKREAESCIG